MRGSRAVVAVGLMVLAAAVPMLTGCACSAGVTGQDASPTAESAGAQQTPAEVIESFYRSESKHGTLTFTSGAGASTEGQKVEYWFDGDRYRITWFTKDGDARLHMISPDGAELYHANVADQSASPSYMGTEFHHWVFNGPPGWQPDAGVAEGDLTSFTYQARKLWDFPDSGQQFYLEDLVVTSDGERIVRAVTRTSSRKPESEEDLVTSSYEFDAPELGASIDAGLFELPYPVE